VSGGDGTVPAGQSFFQINTPVCPAGTHLVDFGGYIDTQPSDAVLIGTNSFGDTGQVIFRNTGSAPAHVTTWSRCTTTTA
jgi:hypothetical protein